ncbi:MAG: protein-L-isoaspartate(D-aspartate) O-methyltransferase [Candidatus Aenigmatarchaeota archaeon]
MNKEQLIEMLVDEGHLKTKIIIEAFRKAPREYFVLDKYKSCAYADEPLPIGKGQTISAPSMVAIILEKINLKPGSKVLEIGGGSGWNAALMSYIVGTKGKVYAMEIFSELTNFAENNIKKLRLNNVNMVAGDGNKGYPKAKPYDVIILSCSSPKIPEELIKQLKMGGKLVLPLGHVYHQILTIVTKTSKGLKEESYDGCVFVPLRSHA